MGMTSVIEIPATSVKRTAPGCYTVFSNWYGDWCEQRPYEFYIIKDGGTWYIDGEQHSARDFEQTEFPTLKTALEYLVPFADHCSDCAIDNMED